MIISVNYAQQGVNYAFMSYYNFETTSRNIPKGVKNIK